MVSREGGDAATLRRALIDLNVRLRSARSRPDTQIVVLFVYYSGHGLERVVFGEPSGGGVRERGDVGIG